MRSLFYSLLYFVVLLVVSGCNKDENRIHSVNVYCYDSQTGEPIKVRVNLYRSTGIPDPSNNPPEQIMTFLGNEDGNTHVEFEVIEDRSYWVNVGRSELQGVGMHYEDPRFAQLEKLTMSGDQSTLEIALDPYYAYQLSAINTNCSDPTDSVWIDEVNSPPLYTGPYQAFGCADTTFNFSFIMGNGIFVLDTNTVTFDVTSKKSGIVQMFSETHALLPGHASNHITISY